MIAYRIMCKKVNSGDEHDSVNHMKKEYARSGVHENWVECLRSLLKSQLQVFRA